MENRCLYCYEPVEAGVDFHKKCSVEFFGTANPPRITYTINEMAELAKEVVKRSISVPGVQAKLSMSLIKDAGKHADPRLTVLGALGEQYILKPPSEHYPEMPANEHVTMKIAQAYGIKVTPSSLVRLASGELCYITKRVDRTKSGEKIHMLDMFQVTEAFDKYKSSMEKVGKALHAYSVNTLLDKIFLLELAVFCFLTGNNDMHLKNFSMIEDPSGWVLAPAYDLLNVSIFNPDDTEELALTLDGKKKKLRRNHFEQWGKELGLTNKQIQGIFGRMAKNKPIALEWLSKSFLSDKMKDAYIIILETRYKQLEIAE